MEGRSYFKFYQYAQLIALGEEAARQQLPAIRAGLARAAAATELPAPSLTSQTPSYEIAPSLN